MLKPLLRVWFCLGSSRDRDLVASPAVFQMMEALIDSLPAPHRDNLSPAYLLIRKALQRLLCRR